jgi:oxygen-independent coproporphyrinogen III oxidase
VSVDLIYGVPGQTVAGWHQGLERALDLGPDHMSLYALQLVQDPDEWSAPPRPGALRWRRRQAARQDDGVAAQQYALAEELLAAAGYRHYELSSWARAGHESRHNSAYWNRAPYTGLGAGAHSYDGQADRSWNAADLDEYLGSIEAGRGATAGTEMLDERTRAFEAVALGLRHVEGFSRGAFAREFGADPLVRFSEATRNGVAQGLLEVDEDRVRLTSAGRLRASDALLAFLPADGGRVDIAAPAAVPFALS